MTVRASVKHALDLLTGRDRKRLLLVIMIQVTTSALDLVGVLAIGVVGALAVASVNETGIPEIATPLAQMLGMENGSVEQLTAVIGATAAALLVLKGLISLWLLRITFRFLARRCAVVSASLSARLMASPILIVQQQPSQQTAYALTMGVSAAVTGTLGPLTIICTEGALLVVVGAALLIVSPTLALVAAAYFAGIAYLINLSVSRWATRTGRMMAEADIASMTTVQEAIASYREITVMNRRSFYRDRFAGFRDKAATGFADNQLITQLPKQVMEAALVIGATGLTAWLFLTRDPIEAVSTLALFLAAAFRIMPSLLRLQGAVTAIRGAFGPANQTYDLAERLDALDQTPSDGVLATQMRHFIESGHPDFEARVSARDISVTYPGTTKAALTAVSFDLAAGSSLALVGATGAGKSTLADVLLGVVTPDSGSVEICGEAPRQAIHHWPGGIAYVPQSVALCDGTVRANVALGLPREAIDDDRIWEALERAHLAEFVRSRDGLETAVGERGVRVSGGQRQRLGIARALYTRPKLLVLDEATSALDAETEAAIAATLRSLEGEVTTITVAHRLATVRDSDLVLLFDHGRIIAQGSFDEVRRSSPRFDRQAHLLGL